MTTREAVIKKRTEAGITLAQLSRKTGITLQKLQNYENGKENLKEYDIKEIFDSLKIEFVQTPQEQWEFAKECAQTLVNIGISCIKSLTQEKVASLT